MFINGLWREVDESAPKWERGGGKNAATKRHFVSCPLDKVHLVAAENDLSRQAARRRRLPLREQLLNHSAAV